MKVESNLVGLIENIVKRKLLPRRHARGVILCYDVGNVSALLYCGPLHNDDTFRIRLIRHLGHT